MIKAGIGEAWLNLGTAAPAIAPMILSRSGFGLRSGLNLRRLFSLPVLTVVS
jgi:hypothetical protein